MKGWSLQPFNPGGVSLAGVGRRPGFLLSARQMRMRRNDSFRTHRGIPAILVEQDYRAIKRRVRACQGFRSFSGCVANAPGHRDNPYDSKGTDPVVNEGRHCWPGCVRLTSPRNRYDGLIIERSTLFTSYARVRNTAVFPMGFQRKLDACS